MGFSFRVAPGVRIRASSRGVSAGLGPRAARVHVSSRGVGLSTGVGPFSAYTSLTGGRSRARSTRGSGPSASSLAAQERAERKAARLNDIRHVLAEQVRLTTLHEQHFPPITKPPALVAPVVSATDRAVEVAAAVKASRVGIRFWRRQARRDAAAAATAAVDAAIADRNRHAAVETARRQDDIDRWWTALLAGDPDTVLTTVNQALSDNERPSAAVAATTTEVSVVVMAPGLDDIPDRTYAQTPSGNPTTKRSTKTERNAMHLAATVGHLIATVKETFAVAPTVGVVRVVMVADSPGGYGVLMAGLVDRTVVDGLYGACSDQLDQLLDQSDLRVNLAGRTQELRPVDLSDDPDLRDLVAAIAAPSSGDDDPDDPVTLTHCVVLTDAGPDPAAVMQQVCAATGVDHAQAADLVSVLPSVIVDDVDLETASRIRMDVERAGADAFVA